MSTATITEDASVLDGLYAAVADAGIAHQDAEAGLSTARRDRDPVAVASALADVRARSRHLAEVAETYRRVLYSLPVDRRQAYLCERHPYLFAG